MPFTQGIIRAFDLYEGTENYLGENGFQSNGDYVITYSRWSFQRGDTTRTSPNLVMKLFDYQNNILWQSQVIEGAVYNQIVNINLGSGSGSTVPQDWKVRGEVKNSAGELLDSGLVKVFDTDEGSEYLLGTSPVLNGTFRINYTKDLFQRGDETRTSPNLLLKVYDSEGAILYQMSSTGTVTPDYFCFDWIAWYCTTVQNQG